jgi:cysteinyl-tRNA synthetase
MGVGELVTLSGALGLLQQPPAPAERELDPATRARIESLVWLRHEARRRRDFAEADRLREELGRIGVVLEDSRDGTTWRLGR